MAAGTIASVLKLGLKISKKSEGTMKGVAKSSKKFDKSAKKGMRIKQRLRIAEMKYNKRRREKKKREEEEAQLEQQKSQRKTPTNRVKAAGKTLLERLISLVQIVVVGFIVNKLPQIIETIKKVIKTIRSIVDKFKAFFDGVVGFFKSIGKVVGNVFNFIKSIDLGGIKDRIQESLSGFKNALGDLTGGFLDGVKSVLGFGKKEEQEAINEESESEANNSEDAQLKTSVKDAQKTLSSQTNSFNDSLKTIKKEGEGSKFLGNERSETFREEIKDIKDPFRNTVIQTLDGRELRRGDEGFEEELAKSRESMVKSMASGGTSDVKQDPPKAQIGDKLNISKPEKKIDTSTITPKRKSKNTVVVVGGSNNSQSPSGGQGSSKDVLIIKEKNNSLKDQAALTLY